MIFTQQLAPIAGSVSASSLAAAAPIVVILVSLGLWRRPTGEAAAAGAAVAFALATLVWNFPFQQAIESFFAGVCFALLPIMWIVFNALLLFNLASCSGALNDFQSWLLTHLPNDRRVLLVVIGFCFSALLEGVAGFGTPVAITSAMLIRLGFRPLDAICYALMFNTAPVAFGALGAPVTTLAAVTGLPAAELAAMIGRQLPFLSLILPAYVTWRFAGLGGVRALWPFLAVAGISFATTQFLVSNFLNYNLTDILSSLVSLGACVAVLRVWRPAVHDGFRTTQEPEEGSRHWRGWAPWLITVAIVIAWTLSGTSATGEMHLAWSGLDRAVFISAYGSLYSAVWTVQPLGTGTAILVSVASAALVLRIPPATVLEAAKKTWVQLRVSLMTVPTIIGLAYLMNYSGMTYTLGLAVAATGAAFPLLSGLLGWLAVFLTGSDTTGNALFGNLQVVVARQLALSPVLLAAANSSGGTLGKMVSLQNICAGTALTEEKGREGHVIARMLPHSLVFALFLGLIVLAQQHLFSWMIPR